LDLGRIEKILPIITNVDVLETDFRVSVST
jgi:hypothetical protein